MQTVSTQYNPYADVIRADVIVSFELVDTEAADTGTPASNGSRPPTQISQILDYSAMSDIFATCEAGEWALDGTRKILPQAYTSLHTGYWSSQLSDENAEFSVNPVITVSFSADVSCVGFSLQFDAASLPYQVKITTTKSGTQVSQGIFNVQGAELIAELPSDGFDTATFEFIGTWMPYSYIKLAAVMFGIVQKFDKNSIISASQLISIDPAMETLPAGEFVFQFDNTDQKYNFLNPSGVYKFLQQQQKINVNYEINGDTVNGGSYLFYTSESDYDGMTATINGTDYAMYLDSALYSITTGGTSTFAQAVTDVKTQSGLDFETNIPETIGNRPVAHEIPDNTSCRDALRLFAQAARCCVYFDRNGVLQVWDMTEADPVAVIDDTNATSVSGVSITERINTLQVKRDSSTENPEEQATAQQLEPGEMVRKKTIINPAAGASPQDVANWLLSVYQSRTRYSLPTQGNPALDPGDVLNVNTIFGMSGDAFVTSVSTTYDGSLLQTVEARG